MIGIVVMVSDHRLRQEVRNELGLPARDASWALVEFKNGYQTDITPGDKCEKVCEEKLEQVDPDRESETPTDYYKNEALGLEVGAGLSGWKKRLRLSMKMISRRSHRE